MENIAILEKEKGLMIDFQNKVIRNEIVKEIDYTYKEKVCKGEGKILLFFNSRYVLNLVETERNLRTHLKLYQSIISNIGEIMKK